MSRRYKHIILSIVLMIYPLISLIRVAVYVNRDLGVNIIEKLIHDFQLSIWLTWIPLVSIAINQKWTTKKNQIFYFTYAYLLIANGVLGYYIQHMVTIFEIRSRFSDTYSLGVFTALQFFVASAMLTAFLQAGVWWFTKRWHRN